MEMYGPGCHTQRMKSYNGNESPGERCGPMLLNKDNFPSIENMCRPTNWVDIRNGRESYSEIQQHGDSRQPSEDLHSEQTPIGTLLETEPSYVKKLSSVMTAPRHVHIYKTKKTPSSQRTQIGSIAHVADAKKMSHSQKINHNKKYNKKKEGSRKSSSMSKFHRESTEQSFTRRKSWRSTLSLMAVTMGIRKFNVHQI
jgi:hypothetical protein